MFGEKLKIEYGGVECGFVILKIKEGFSVYEFIFDENLSDPFPKLVNFYLNLQNGRNCSESFTDTYDERIIVFKISAQFDNDKVFLTIELTKKEITLNETFRRQELLNMIKKIFDSLLSDKYFPYSYPCFLYISEISGTTFSDAIMDTIQNSRRDSSNGDILNNAVESGRLKLEPHHKRFIANYRRMLTHFIIPNDWFD